ncbi:MAG: hypothetical protein QMD01_05915 [Thermodesulfovibrionales bacterium]|nr:hypothetical protein [Thermodesulfovibrionales bacterium]
MILKRKGHLKNYMLSHCIAISKVSTRFKEDLAKNKTLDKIIRRIESIVNRLSRPDTDDGCSWPEDMRPQIGFLQ